MVGDVCVCVHAGVHVGVHVCAVSHIVIFFYQVPLNCARDWIRSTQ